MAFDISQIVASSYNAVVNDKRTPANQWAESAAMRVFEKMGFIQRKSLGPKIEATIDYRRNPGTEFLDSDLQPMSLAKTEVLTAAEFDPGELSVPVVWSKRDDALNPSENQKIAFVKTLLTNGLDSHDDALEEAIFASLTGKVLGLAGLIPTTGQGNVGGIDAGTETMWRNPADTYLADGSDIEAVLTELWSSASKGSGSTTTPKLLISGAEAVNLFESTQVSQQRFNDTSKLDAGFKEIAFKTAPMIFSQYGDDKIYGLHPKAFKMVVSKEYFRDKGETKELDGANGFRFFIYSALQNIVAEKSRLFVASEA